MSAATEPVPHLVVPSRPRGLLAPVHPGPMMLVAALVLAPLFLNQYWTFNVAAGLTVAISCLGLQVLLGWSREISLMHAGVTGAATYLAVDVTYIVYMHQGPPYEYRRLPGGRMGYEALPPGPEPFLIGGAAAVLFAAALYLTVGLLVRRLAALYVLVLTFAVQFALEVTLFTQEVLTGGVSRPTPPRPQVFGVALTHDRRAYWAIVLVLLALILVLHRLRRSRFGRAIALAGREPEAAAAVGISPWRCRAFAFALAGLCAGLSGATQNLLYSQAPGILNYISPNSLVYLAVVVLAGSVSLLAVVAVALAYVLIPVVMLDWHLNAPLIGGIGMAIGLLLGTRGIGGVVIDLFGGRPKRWGA